MILYKCKIASLMVLVLAVAGTWAAVFAPRSQPERQPESLSNPAKPPATPKTEAGVRPPLKKEWVGRWQRDPFAGTVAIELDRGNRRVTDPQKVAALMKKLTIRAFHNGMAQDFPMIARLTFLKHDRTRVYVWVGEGPFFSGVGGEMHIDPAFLVALGRQFPNESGQPLDLLKPQPSHPTKRWMPLTLDKLKTGLESFEVSYPRGSRQHHARITDPSALKELAKALVVTKQESEKTPKAEDWPPQQFHFQCKGEADVPAHNGCILDREHLVVSNLGRVEVKPSFVKTLNAQLSRLEGQSVDVLDKNPRPPEQLRREHALRDLLTSARRLRFHREDGKEILVSRREDVERLLKSLAWVQTPVRAWKLERFGGFIEVTTAKQESIRLTYLDTGLSGEKVDVNPGGDLVEVSGFGPMWLDGHFRDAVRLYAEQWQRKDEERRDKETFHLVCQDLPAFLEQVFNLVAHYREGKDELMVCLTAEDSRPILEALRQSKIEKLSWTDKQWDEEVEKLEKSGAGSLDLEPGMGFHMFVIFRGEKELLVPRYGRLLLQEPIVDKLRKALESDPKKAKNIEFLPRE